MPETDFLGTSDDEERIIRFALDLGMQVVPDLRYASRDILVISEWESFRRIRHETSLFYLFSETTCSSPFQTRGLQGLELYYIQQRYGGPYVMFLNHLPYEESGVAILPGGSISYYPTFYDSLTGDLVYPSGVFKKLYRTIDAEIKRGAICSRASCVDGGTRDYWLTPEGQAAVKRGAKLAVDGLGSSLRNS